MATIRNYHYAGKSLLVMIVMLTPVGLYGASSHPHADSPHADSPHADNTKVNKRDASSLTPTADQQANDSKSVDTTRRIRSAIVGDKKLSTYAHNIKIITQGDEVFLRGPVRSQDEKVRVEQLAIKAAGTAVVKSELEIAPK